MKRRKFSKEELILSDIDLETIKGVDGCKKQAELYPGNYRSESPASYILNYKCPSNRNVRVVATFFFDCGVCDLSCGYRGLKKRKRR